MQKKLFFIIFLIADIISAYELLERFPSFMSRVFGFSLCLFFINTLLFFWMRHLTQQQEATQKEIILPVGKKKGVVNTSLYDILHDPSNKEYRTMTLYGELFFSLSILFLNIFFIGMAYASGKVDALLELQHAISSSLLPYYAGFCLSSIMTPLLALMQNRKNDVVGPLRREFMIKLIQAVFITAFYEVGGPVLFLVAITSFMRLYSKGKPS